MNHSQKTIQLGRKSGQRRALLATMAVSLVRDEKIQTTETKAKVLRPLVERLVTLAKKGDVATRRILISKVGQTATKKLMSDLAKKYEKRNGGYLRITKLNDRKNDGAKLAQIEFV